MARRSNIGRTVPLRLSTTPEVVKLLEQLATTGFHGKNAAEIAEELLRQQLLTIQRDKDLMLRLQRRRTR